MGIIWTTRGWSGAAITVTVVDHGSPPAGFGHAHLYEVAGDVQNAFEVAQDLRSWMLDPARGWFPVMTGVTVAIAPGNDGRVWFVYTPTFSSPNAELTFERSGTDHVVLWNKRMAVKASTEFLNPAGATRGSCSAIPGTVLWERVDNEEGARCRAGSFRVGHPTLSPRRPTVELGLDLRQAWAFGEAARIAASPRRGYVYDEAGATWWLVTIGRHDLQPHKPDDHTKAVGTIELLGGI